MDLDGLGLGRAGGAVGGGSSHSTAQHSKCSRVCLLASMDGVDGGSAMIRDVKLYIVVCVEFLWR